MRLQAGAQAPDFTAVDLEGRSVSLAPLKGQKVWLSFFRFAACPLCSYRILELLTNWDRLFSAYDFTLVTVWQSPQSKLEEIKERYTPSFTLIPDPDMELYKLYGVEAGLTKFFSSEVPKGLARARKAGIRVLRTWDGPAGRCPADFLISEEGEIQVAFYGTNVANMIPYEQVTEFLEGRTAAAPE